jgi:hypothetical protein
LKGWVAALGQKSCAASRSIASVLMACFPFHAHLLTLVKPKNEPNLFEFLTRWR